MSSSATTLHDFALELLQSCADALDTTDAGAPDRQFVSPGLPVIDCCSMLAVFTSSLLDGPTSPGSPPMVTGHRSTFMKQPTAIFTVLVARCVPVGEGNANNYRPPSVAQLNAVSEITDQDIWVIYNYLNWKMREGDSFLGKCQAEWIYPATPLDPSGGCGGWTIPIQVAMNGYNAYNP